MDKDKKLIDTLVLQVETSNGDWINIKAVDLAEGEEWDHDIIKLWKPKFRKTFITPDEDDPDEYVSEENDDKRFKRAIVKENE